MKATIVLADAATGHSDNTFSLLRGGIDRVHIPRNAPPSFRGALVVRIHGDPSEYGRHEFRIACLTSDGEEVAPPIAAVFEIPKGGGVVNVVLNIQLALPRIGRYEFAVTADSHSLGAQAFEVVEKARSEQKLEGVG